PFETPATMLLMWARVVPHSTRARLVSDLGFTTTLPSCTAAAISLLIGSFSVPSLPLAVSVWPATSTVTPCGMATGYLPMRDMGSTSEDAAQDLAADIGGAGLVVRHDAARRRQDSDTQPVIDARQIGNARVDAPPRLRNTGDLADHWLAVDVFELDRELGHAGPRLLPAVAADIALALQHFQHIGANLRRRRQNGGLACLLPVSDTGEQIAERIGHRHALALPYQLDLTMPGIWPDEASSRSAMRDSLNLR